MKIQFFSDIHLEFGHFEVPKTDADVVVAAGDIGVGLQGIEWLSRFEAPTIYVAGNHEFYGGDLIHTRAAIAEFDDAPRVHFLENESVEINGVRFLGATLWTDYFSGDEEAMMLASHQMNDYRQIRCDSRSLTPEHLYELNWESRFWLARALDQPFDGKTVVVTHHAPSLKSWPQEKTSDFRATYCNQMDDFFDRYHIDVWIHGHVHAVKDYRYERGRVLCNPRGYTGYQVIDGFAPTRMIEL